MSSQQQQALARWGDIQTAWQGILGALRKFHSEVQVRPGDAGAVFHIDRSGAFPRFEVRPVTFCVPERAGSGSPDLYIAVEGWIAFDEPLKVDPRPTTRGYGTRVGYFRLDGSGLSHVYGTHYDMDDSVPGHPLFHAQLGSQLELGCAVRQHYRIAGGLVDKTVDLLRNVRTPTAQMDVFSVITQIGADHLLSERSDDERLQAFLRLRQACDFFMGAAGRVARLNQQPAPSCYRSTHWYARTREDSATAISAH